MPNYQNPWGSYDYGISAQQPQQPPRGGMGAMAGLRGLLGNPDLAMALLANSGYSPQKRGFGEILGTSMQQAQAAGSQRQDDEFKRKYMEAQMAALGQHGQERSPYGQYQPGDYTPESWAAFMKSNDPSALKRYSTPRQEFSPSFQNVTQTLPDGSTQQGTFDTRTGAYNWKGAVVPAGTKARTTAEGTAEGTITGTRNAKTPLAYDTYRTAIGSLSKALEATTTNPIAGAFPDFTAAQQTAEGSIANMAPVLKDLFRQSGEGTFTEGDQALLLKMIPTRKDHPEARAAKLEMIDGIVKAKLGIRGDAPMAPAGIARPAAGATSPASAQGQAPAEAIAHLKAHPELAEQFKAKYGYLP